MTRCISSLSALMGLLALAVPARADTTNAPLARSVVLENNVAYLRIGTVAGNLADEITAAEHTLAATNKIAGYVLDLRFAGGDDFAAARSTAGLFAGQKQPMAILVNGQTHAAATSLAATLHKDGVGLVYGSTAEPAVQAGENIPAVVPDIAVPVKLEDEKKFLENPYAPVAQAETNSSAGTNNYSPFIDHTSEADLVRAKIKDGEEDEDLAPAGPTEPQPPFIQDPVLARAVDLIKGLAALHPARS